MRLHPVLTGSLLLAAHAYAQEASPFAPPSAEHFMSSAVIADGDNPLTDPARALALSAPASGSTPVLAAPLASLQADKLQGDETERQWFALEDGRVRPRLNLYQDKSTRLSLSMNTKGGEVGVRLRLRHRW
ncbi:hypothetical protein [Crenobacter caeni]|uniref:Uncharacterized protein n=1 Tax=Crenobacter caeni TaxID=2705474 RepID=A0A6B2KPS0_9NEIS|nr:hypothetical protein [Crenobacter caeni]NDV12133.1 hypothetical protein [Crenobacter caeni]